MDLLNGNKIKSVNRPIKVVQFGEGNFLRAFVDYMIDIANEYGSFDGNIVLVKPIPFGSLDMFHKQDCRYTVSLRGNVNGEAVQQNRIVTSVEDAVDSVNEYDKYIKLAEIDTLRFIVSNTTEAGIVYDAGDCFDMKPPKSFPGKLTQFLYHRFETFNGDPQKGLVILPVELIDDNGMHLKECVLKQIDNWGLSDSFKKWVCENCIFTQTLVDRIVTGYPKADAQKEWDEMGYEDNLLVTAEPFGLWVIESDKEISKEFDLPSAGLPVVFTKDHHPYKQRKVRILNGAHTSFVPMAFRMGEDIVRDCMNDDDIRNFMLKTIYDEVIPTLSLPEDDLKKFASEVVNRFNNPYVDHALLAISLNSVSKWRARCLPTLLDYVKKYGKLPIHLTFSIAALLDFYGGKELENGVLKGHRGESTYDIKDDETVLKFFADRYLEDAADLVKEYLGREDFHGMDLNTVPGLTEAVTGYLNDIRENGMRQAMKRIG